MIRLSVPNFCFLCVVCLSIQGQKSAQPEEGSRMSMNSNNREAQGPFVEDEVETGAFSEKSAWWHCLFFGFCLFVLTCLCVLFPCALICISLSPEESLCGNIVLCSKDDVLSLSLRKPAVSTSFFPKRMTSLTDNWSVNSAKLSWYTSAWFPSKYD